MEMRWSPYTDNGGTCLGVAGGGRARIGLGAVMPIPCARQAKTLWWWLRTRDSAKDTASTHATAARRGTGRGVPKSERVESRFRDKSTDVRSAVAVRSCAGDPVDRQVCDCRIAGLSSPVCPCAAFAII